MSEIHICSLKNGILYIPKEANAPDGEYIIAPGMRCNITIFTHTAFEKMTEVILNGNDAHQRLYRHIESRACIGEIKGQKTTVPDVLLESIDGDGCVTVEFIF